MFEKQSGVADRKVESRRILKQFANTAGYNAVLFLSSRFLLFYILGKNLSPTEYGAYNLVTNLITLGVYGLGLGLCHYLIREVPGKPEQEGLRLLKSTLSFQALVCLLILTLLVLTGLYGRLIRILQVTAYARLYSLALVLLFEELVVNEIGRFLQTRKEIEKSNLLDFFRKVSWIYALAAMWLFGLKPTLAQLVLFRIVAVAFSILLGLKTLHFRAFWSASFNPGVVKKAAIFSLPMFLSSLSDQIMLSVDRFVLSSHHGPAEAGIYAFVSGLLNTAYTFTGAMVIAVIFPYVVAEHNNQSFLKRDLFLTYMFKYSVLSTGLFLAGLMLGAKPLLSFLARSEYLSGIGLMPLLAAGVLFYAASYPAGIVLFLENKTRLVLASTLAGMILNLILNLLLVPSFRAYGAAMASLSSYALVGFLQYLLSGAWRKLSPGRLLSLEGEKALWFSLRREDG